MVVTLDPTALLAAVAALATYAKQRRTEMRQADTLERIEHQTNGVLDDKIRAAVKEVLDRHPNVVTGVAVEAAVAQLLRKHLVDDERTDQ